MKDASFTVEFTQHVLANSVGSQGERDVFLRDGEENLIFQQSWWHSAFARALEMEHLRHIKPGDITVDLIVNAPTEMYYRRYGKGKSRRHEAIAPGTVVTFYAVVYDRVTESTFKHLLDRIGRFIGISPYGHNLGYGTFQVLDVAVELSESAKLKQHARG